MLGTIQGLKVVAAMGAGMAGYTALRPIFDESMTKIEVARYVNESSQIQDAIMMAQQDGATGKLSLRMLKAGQYLSRIPKGWDPTSTDPTKPLPDQRICGLINEEIDGSARTTECPPCPSTEDGPPACTIGGRPVMRPM